MVFKHIYMNKQINNNKQIMKKGKKTEKNDGKKKRIMDDGERKSRGKAQKIFLILTHEYDNNLERKYEVMGTTGNVYLVTINNSPTCTCPDHVTRSKRCKHIYFVLTRIMMVKTEQEDIKKYTDNDLEDMFTNIPRITENLKVDAKSLEKYKTLKKNSNGKVDKRNIDQDDMCPVCLGDLEDIDEEIIFCEYSCGACIHKDCFNMFNSKKTGTIKCLFCHKDWAQELKQHYINLDVK